MKVTTEDIKSTDGRKNNGGARQGAGRKPSSVEKRGKKFLLSVELIDRLDQEDNASRTVETTLRKQFKMNKLK